MNRRQVVFSDEKNIIYEAQIHILNTRTWGKRKRPINRNKVNGEKQWSI